jgi:tripartite ATP-independent transporter DctM subunit
MIGALLVSFVVLAVAGVPIAAGMGIAVIVTMAFFTPLPTIGAIQRMITGVDSFVLISIPFFMLTGRLMNVGGITTRLFAFARSLVGPIRGGMAHANVLANMILAGMSGSAVADAGGMGVVVIKAMQEQGYRRELAAAITVAASTIGPIIPPSIPMVIYGAMAEVSVGKLFLGGFVPGVLMGLSLMGLIAFWNRRERLPVDRAYHLREIWKAFREAFLSLLTPIILIGGILSGIFTPTEASAVAAVYAFILSFFILRTVKVADIPGIIVDTFVTTAVVTFIISTTSGFSYLLIIGRIGTLLVESTLALTTNPYVVLLIVKPRRGPRALRSHHGPEPHDRRGDAPGRHVSFRGQRGERGEARAADAGGHPLVRPADRRAAPHHVRAGAGDVGAQLADGGKVSRAMWWNRFDGSTCDKEERR